MEDWEQVRATFQQIWGYADFRPPQGDIIQTLLKGKDALIVMPTGGGKSICFQLPALLQTGLTLVVSPLVALMENQVLELKERQLPAALLHSEVPSYLRKQTLSALEKQQLRLLYLSPETLLSPPVWDRLIQPQLKINGLILDEAHCLVEWGETFRPAYRRLGAVRPTLLQYKPAGTKIAIAAFTATAAPTTKKVIQQTLQLSQPETFLQNPYRPNLHLKVQTVWTPKGRRQQLLRFIQTQGKQSGLVYLRSRKESETLATWLRSLHYNTTAYHAGLSPEERREIETHWLTGKIQFVICTNAFGMGVNKSNVRWVVHFQPPQLLSEYLQEIGRGGRDGKPTQALTLTSEPTGFLNPEDQQQRKFFAQKLERQYQEAQQLANQLPPQGEIANVVKQFSGGDIALSLLNRAGQVQWLDPFHYQTIKAQDASLVKLLTENKKKQKEMLDFLMTKACRWQFLLSAFGFQKEAKGFKCGSCDCCRR